MTLDESLSEAIKRDYRTVELSGADRAMLDYVATLTLTPDGTWIGWRPRSRDVKNEKPVFYAELSQLYVPSAGVVEGEFVELTADDLPCLRRLMRLVVPEIERLRKFPALVNELHAVLLDEAARLHLLQ